MKTLNEILNELIIENEVVDLINRTPKGTAPIYHFSLGLYIRNKYLWCDRETAKSLMTYFNVEQVDDVSTKIVEILIEKIKKGETSPQSSNPNK